MKKLSRTLQAVLVSGFSIFTLAPAFAGGPARVFARFLILSASMLMLFLPLAFAQETGAILGDEPTSAEVGGPTIRPVRTDSPRDTLATFLRLRDGFEKALIDYRAERSVRKAEQLVLIAAQFRALIDLSEVVASSRQEVGNDTMGYLLDIFGRVDLPNLDDVPDEDDFDDESLAQYRIPNTPIRITRIDTGPREGEFLFNSRTVLVAPRFFLSVSDLPLRSNLGSGAGARRCRSSPVPTSQRQWSRLCHPKCEPCGWILRSGRSSPPLWSDSAQPSC